MPCRKKEYSSKTKAEDSMYDHWRKPRPGKMPVRAYPCPTCHHWHLTSEPLRARH